MPPANLSEEQQQLNLALSASRSPQNLSEEEQLALAISASESPPGYAALTEEEQLALALRQSSEEPNLFAPLRNHLTEEQLAVAQGLAPAPAPAAPRRRRRRVRTRTSSWRWLSLSMAQLPPPSAAPAFAAPAAAGRAVPRSMTMPAPATPRGPRPRVVNSGVINDARTGAPIMYYTCQAPTGSITQQRFSSFVKLLDSVGRLADGKQNDRLEHWKRTLLLEKRHTGAKSRSQPVVQSRIGMLQRMLDDLFDFPRCGAPAVRHFLGLPSGTDDLVSVCSGIVNE